MKNKVIASENLVKVPKDWKWEPLSDRLSKNMVYSEYVRACHDCQKIFKSDHKAMYCPECTEKHEMERQQKVIGDRKY